MERNTVEPSVKQTVIVHFHLPSCSRWGGPLRKRKGGTSHLNSQSSPTSIHPPAESPRPLSKSPRRWRGPLRKRG